MTAPPGGPYGQDPSGMNPYGQDPYWGGQPQGGQPQGGPYQNPQGAPYQYPGPYGNPPGGPYAAGGYPPPGQQYPPGWPSGPYSPGPPPTGPRSKAAWWIVAGIAVLAVIALVLILVFTRGNENKPTTAAPSSTISAPTSSLPGTSEQTATDCTPNVSGGEEPSGDTVSAGKLSFPTSAAPGWSLFSDNTTPNAIGAVGVAQEVPGAEQWIMQAEVAITNFVASMDVAAQASKLMTCVANGPGYSSVSPTLGPAKTSSTTVDGTEAARVDADITIGDTSRNVKGDSVTIITVKTKPVTFFYGATPIGDADSKAAVEKVIAALQVSQ